MPTLTIKGIPEALYKQLKKRAAEQRRSLNSEIIVCLEQAVTVNTDDPKAILAKTDALRARLRVPRLTESRLRATKGAGRP